MPHTTQCSNCEACHQRRHGIFCDLDDQAISQVSAQKITNTYKRGQSIFHQGNPPYGLYCVRSGKVKIAKIGSDGKESIVRIAHAGDVLGHRSLFSNENYTASATTLEDSVLCFIDKKFIHKIIMDHPEIALKLIQQLSLEMGQAEERNAAMFQKNVRERLAGLFLNLARQYGVKEDGRIRLDIRLTREELASMIGTANETVIRFITEFKEEGLIDQEGKILFLLDPQRLEEFATGQPT